MRRSLTLLIGFSGLMLLQGCQHLPAQQWIRAKLGMASSMQSLQDHATACLAKSHLSQPAVLGHVIDTPRYAMLTLAKQQPAQNAVVGGELCIVNKINQHIEITAVDDLRYVTPTATK